MTGADVKQQVDAALEVGWHVAEYEGADTEMRQIEEARAAHAPCVVLTAEEAERVRATLADGREAEREMSTGARYDASIDAEYLPVIALLGADDDVGSPPPGEGDDLENPEIGMVC